MSKDDEKMNLETDVRDSLKHIVTDNSISKKIHKSIHDEIPPLENSASDLLNIPNQFSDRGRSTYLNQLNNDSSQQDLQKMILDAVSKKKHKWEPKNEILVQYEYPDLDEWEIVRKEKSNSQFTTIHNCRKLIYNSYYSYFIIGIILCSLFFNNIKFLIFDKRADSAFDVFNFIMMAIFIFDFAINNIAGNEYFISFYFWMDIASLILFIFDFSFIREKIFENDDKINRTSSFNFYVILEVLKILRIILLSKYIFRKRFKNSYSYYKNKLLMPNHIIRLVEGSEVEVQRNNTIRHTQTRISFSEQKYSYNPNENRETNMSRAVHQGVSTQLLNKNEKIQESKISRRMVYLTNKRLMMVLLLMLIFIPMFSTYFWTDITHAYETDMDFLVIYFKEDSVLAENFVKTQLQNKYDEYKLKLLYVNLPNIVSLQINNEDHIRHEELRIFESTVAYSDASYSAIGTLKVSLRRLVQYQALLNILRVIIIIVFFIIGVFYFEKDARDKILGPLERMLAKVRAMATNPSKALALSKKDTVKYNSDIAVIDETIQKIAYLLVLGFGEAGNSLLSKILYTKDFQIDFLSEASQVYGIYGFCDIRNFTDATEILKEDVLLFVNAIADVVHEEVHLSEGGANKNIGDAFLVVWKLYGDKESNITTYLDPQITTSHKERMVSKNSSGLQDNQRYINDMYNSHVAEYSLVSFLKIIARVTTDEEITKYNSNEKLIKALPNFKVSLGFGLHIGWSIEGAIGSKFKIDMSYLSPNVNWSSRLEGLTKTYHKELLFTDTLYFLFTSSSIKKMCRKIDRVIVNGAEHSTDIYTIDIQVEELRNWYIENKVKNQVELGQGKTLNDNTQKKFIQSYKNIKLDNFNREKIKLEKFKEGIQISKISESKLNGDDKYYYYNEIETMYENITLDQRLVVLLELQKQENSKKYPKQYNDLFQELFMLYKSKDWELAQIKVNELKEFMDQQNKRLQQSGQESYFDESINVINEEMMSFNYKAPNNWVGRSIS